VLSSLSSSLLLASHFSTSASLFSANKDSRQEPGPERKRCERRKHVPSATISLSIPIRSSAVPTRRIDHAPVPSPLSWRRCVWYFISDGLPIEHSQHPDKPSEKTRREVIHLPQRDRDERNPKRLGVLVHLAFHVGRHSARRLCNKTTSQHPNQNADTQNQRSRSVNTPELRGTHAPSSTANRGLW
jgi:hypothetical protein